MPENSKIIIGIDPGTRITGFGVIEVKQQLHPVEYGCILPPSSMMLTQRYKILFESALLLFTKYTPSAVAIENQYMSKNIQSTLKLGMARGVITLAATLQQIPVFEYAPSQAKCAVVGNGRASKTQVQAMVKILLNLKELPDSEDASDALALAICHANALSKDWIHKNQI